MHRHDRRSAVPHARPAGPGRAVPPDSHHLASLQRSIGNRGVVALVQRVSHADDIANLGTDEERAKKLATLSVDDLLDTVFDKKAGAAVRTAGVTTAVSALGDADRRRVSLALRCASGPYDEPFYYDFGLLDPTTRDAIWERLRTTHPQVATPTARSATIFAALAGFIRAEKADAAFRLLNGYAFTDILNVLLVAHAGGMVATLEANWPKAVGVNVDRLKAAVYAVKLVDMYRRMGVKDAPVTDVLAKAATDSLQTYEGELDRQIAQFTAMTTLSDEDSKALLRAQSSKTFVGLAREDLAKLAPVAKTISADDQAAMKVLFGDEAAVGFAAIVGADVVGKGQFALSTALADAIDGVINAQYDRIPTTAAEKAELTTVDAALNAAMQDAHPQRPGQSYTAVHTAATALLKKVGALARAHGMGLDAAFTAALRQAVPAPPAKKTFAKILETVFTPLWKKWLETQSFPDLNAFRNVYQLVYLKMADKWACQPATLNLAQLYYLKTASRPKDPAVKLPFTQLYTGRSATKDSKGNITDERVVYRKDLAAIVEKMRQALDGGWLIHVRVMSGMAMDNTAKVEAGEHSLLITGYRGNEFTCADSDPKDQGAEHLTAGFTALYYDPTANTFASAVGAGLGMSSKAYQQNRRHRYQAWTAAAA